MNRLKQIHCAIENTVDVKKNYFFGSESIVVNLSSGANVIIILNTPVVKNKTKDTFVQEWG